MTTTASESFVPEAGAPESPERRRFLARVSLGVGGACALLGVPAVGFVVAPIFKQAPRIWRGVGRAEDFAVGETVNVTFLDSSPLPWSGITGRSAAWLRRATRTDFIAFSVNCSHLGCPVRWLPAAGLFVCPCHGGAYYADGRVAAGPPPHPLPRYPVRVRDGEVEIRADPVPIGAP